MLLQSLGAGLGLAAVDTENFGSLRTAGIGTGIWSIIAPLIAMFVGALLAGKLCGARGRSVGAMHGAVVWAISVILGVWAVTSLISSFVGGVASVGGAAAKSASQAISGENAKEAASALGIDANDLLGPINAKLQAQGKPPVTSEQLEVTIRAVAKRGIRQGSVDREVVVEELTRNTALSREDAQDVAGRVADRVNQAGKRIERGAKDAALEAADKTGKALLFGGVMMLLSLGAALGGGALGVRGRTRDDDVYRTTRTPVVPPPEPPPPASHTIIEP